MDSILIVEDDRLILELIAEVMEIFGYRVIPFKNADAAWSFIEGCCYRPRLLITDLQMPGEIDGVELVKRVQDMHPRTPIVIASGYHCAAETLLGSQIIGYPSHLK